MMAVFRILMSNAFYGFGDFAKEAAVALKCKGPLL